MACPISPSDDCYYVTDYTRDGEGCKIKGVWLHCADGTRRQISAERVEDPPCQDTPKPTCVGDNDDATDITGGIDAIINDLSELPVGLTPPALTALTQGCNTILDDLQKAVETALAACAIECDDVAADCTACIRGQLSLYADRANAIGDACKERVESAIIQAGNVAVGIIGGIEASIKGTEFEPSLDVAMMEAALPSPSPVAPPPVAPPPPPDGPGSPWCNPDLYNCAGGGGPPDNDMCLGRVKPKISPTHGYYFGPDPGDPNCSCPDGYEIKRTSVKLATHWGVLPQLLATCGISPDSMVWLDDMVCIPCPPPPPDEPPDLPDDPDVEDGDSICNVKEIKSVLEKSTAVAGETAGSIAEYLIVGDWSVTSGASSWIASLFGYEGGGIVGNVVNSIIKAAGGAGDNAIDMFGKIAGCDDPKWSGAAATQAAIGFVDRWTNAVPNAISTKAEYTLNYLCPYLLPTTSDANALYIQQFISTEQWECLVKANGDCPPWQQYIVDQQKLRLDPHNVVMAYRRGAIEEDDYKERFKKLGIKDDDERKLFYRMTEAIPLMPDIVRFMIRDSADEEVVKEFKYDSGFDEKFSGKLKEWAVASGVEEDIARYFWRAHWDIPSSTALYSMLHRLRPDRPKRGTPYDDINVDAAKIEQAITVNDMAPGWVKPMMAISYSNLTRVDIRRFHCLGIIPDDDLIHRYQDIGYDKDVAKLQSDFTIKANKESGSCKRVGFTINSALTAYQNYGMTRGEVEPILLELGMKQEQVGPALDGIDKRNTSAARVTNRKLLQKRYMFGDLSYEDTQTELFQIGLDERQASQLIDSWKTALKYRRKEATASTLCKWFNHGQISAEDYHRRLLNIGYAEQDVLRIMNLCVGTAAEKLAKAAASEAEKAEKKIEQDKKRKAAACARAAKSKKTQKEKYELYFGVDGPTNGCPVLAE